MARRKKIGVLALVLALLINLGALLFLVNTAENVRPSPGAVGVSLIGFSEGINWDIQSLPVVNDPSTGNNGNGATSFIVNVSVSGGTARVYIRANGNLVDASSGESISLANELYSFSTTDPTVSGAAKHSLDTDDQIVIDEFAGGNIYFKFFLNVDEDQSPGTYGNLIQITAEYAGPLIDPPTNLQVLGSSPEGVSLSWNDNSDNEDGFVIEKSSTSASTGFGIIGAVGANVDSFTDVLVTADSQYWYRVYAYNSEAASDYSNMVVASTSEVTSLGINEVYIKNGNIFNLNNDLVKIPISFEKGSQPNFELDLIKIGNLPTQVVPTSFHSDGTVRTAVAKVLASTGAGQKEVYTIGSGTSGSFNMMPRTADFLDNGRLRIVARDLLGGEYEAFFDISDPFTELIEDGPVTKVYKMEKKLRPVVNCNSMTSHPSGQCLSYLFSATVFVTAVSGKENVKVDFFVTNFGNLDEDKKTGSTFNHNGKTYFDYEEGQNGFIFYDSIFAEIVTPNAHTWEILDEEYIYPSFKEGVSSTTTRFWVMPSNGQEILHNEFSDGPNTSNYIGLAQSLLTRTVLYLGTPHSLGENYFEDNSISSGQSLARWNMAGEVLFDDLINPDSINPNFNFAADAISMYNSVKNTVSNPDRGRRWGIYMYANKDLGSTGYTEQLKQDDARFVKYILSCIDECQTKYLDSNRFYLYGAAHATNHLIGFRPDLYPDAYTYGYRAPLYEDYTGGPGTDTNCCNDGRDVLGLGTPDKNADIEYRKDAQGRTMNQVFSNGPTGDWSWRWHTHAWSIRDGAHFSVSTELSKYMLEADYPGYFLAENQVNTLTGQHNWKWNHEGILIESVRDWGRSLLNIGRFYSVTQLPIYKENLGYIITHLENVRNKDEPSVVHPVTGDYLPVKFFQPQSMVKVNGPVCNIVTYGQQWCWIQLFEEAQVLHGLSYNYKENDLSPALKQTVENQLNDALFFWSNFAYKKYDQVRNGYNLVIDGTTVQVREDQGGLAYMSNNPGVVRGLSDVNLPANSIKMHNFYRYGKDNQIYQGWCNAVKLASEIGLDDAAEHKEKFLDVFDRAYIISGITLGTLSDTEICGLRVAGLPNALEANAHQITGEICTDNDGDGYTNCILDLDNNANVFPGKGEICNNGIDDNLNGLTDCNDAACSGQSICSSVPRCGNLVINTGELCDVNGSAGFGINSCTSKKCGVAFTPLTGGNNCQCGI